VLVVIGVSVTGQLVTGFHQPARLVGTSHTALLLKIENGTLTFPFLLSIQ
jgi:hypothetical protein